MTTRHVGIVWMTMLLMATTGAHAAALAPPLVDGDCGEYPGLGVRPLTLAPKVDLFVYQDAHYVWLCYTYPDNSFGTVDVRLETPALSAPLNLHVSAQLGEWPAEDPEAAPQDPQSDRWWNARGWIANPVWANGLDDSGETVRTRYKNAPARELQLSQGRFGRGEWRFSLKIGLIRGADGKFYEVNFPADGSLYTLPVGAPQTTTPEEKTPPGEPRPSR